MKTELNLTFENGCLNLKTIDVVIERKTSLHQLRKLNLLRMHIISGQKHISRLSSIFKSPLYMDLTLTSKIKNDVPGQHLRAQYLSALP